MQLRLIALLLLLSLFSACTEDPLFEEDQIATSEEANNSNDTPANLEAEYQELLNLVNDLRASGCLCGNEVFPPVAPLSWNEKLANAALRHSNDMARNNHFAHQGTDGSSAGERVTAAGYIWQRVGENIAWNYPTAAAVFDGWKNSPGHCRNMMNANFQDMGAARVGAYYSQDFGTKQGS